MSRNMFWWPASEPTGEELESTMLLTFLQNIFSTQHSPAVREAARLQRKRQRVLQQDRKGGNRQHDEFAEKEEEEGKRTFFNIITSLVHATGVPYEISVNAQNTDSPQQPSLVAEPTTNSSAPQPAPEATPGEDTTEFRNKDMQPRSALAALVKNARLQEQSKQSEGIGNTHKVASMHYAENNRTNVIPRAQQHKDSRPIDSKWCDDFGVALPLGPLTEDGEKNDDGSETSHPSATSVVKHPSQMSQEEFLRQFKRAPRRGEIGYDADRVAAAEAVGYVMSGSRNKEKQHYVDGIQRKLHEKEARKLRLQFRKVEDERNDNTMMQSIIAMVNQKEQKKNS